MHDIVCSCYRLGRETLSRDKPVSLQKSKSFCEVLAMSVLPPSFPTGASKKERAVILAPIINEMCQRMLSGVDIGGVESFQYQILALIKKAELLKDE